MKKITPKSEEGMEAPMAHTAEKRYPTFRIELEHLPEAKKWEIGKEYTVTLKLKMTGISISKFQNDSEYEIIGIDVKGSKEK